MTERWSSPSPSPRPRQRPSTASTPASQPSLALGSFRRAPHDALQVHRTTGDGHADRLPSKPDVRGRSGCCTPRRSAIGPGPSRYFTASWLSMDFHSAHRLRDLLEDALSGPTNDAPTASPCRHCSAVTGWARVTGSFFRRSSRPVFSCSSVRTTGITSTRIDDRANASQCLGERRPAPWRADS